MPAETETIELKPLKVWDAEVMGWLADGDITADEAWEMMDTHGRLAAISDKVS